MLRKRGVLGDIAIGTGGIMLGASFSNFISTVVAFFNPNSERHRIHRLEVSHNEIVHSLQAGFNITRAIDDQIQSNIVHLGAEVKANNIKITHLEKILPQITWVSNFIFQRIEKASSELEEINLAYRQNKLPIAALAHLLSLTQLYDQLGAEGQFISISKKNENTITFRFAIMPTVSSFRTWTKLTSNVSELTRKHR